MPTRMRVLRTAAGLTQSDLAVATGIVTPTLSRIERGIASRGPAREKHLRKIADALHFEEAPELLMHRHGEVPQPNAASSEPLVVSHHDMRLPLIDRIRRALQERTE